VIVQNAVRVINPRPPIDNEEHEKYGEYALPSFNSSGETLAAEGVETADILDLGPFERFVFVMLILEHYSEHECSILLGCPRRDVIAARARGLQQLRSAMELHPERQVNVSSEKAQLHDNCRSAVENLLHV
jgi:DNA-directed RNA polymerase specialized sigma24 family protein